MRSAMSAFGGKADMAISKCHVCFRPKADMSVKAVTVESAGEFGLKGIRRSMMATMSFRPRIDVR
jgi:hypothetical protein